MKKLTAEIITFVIGLSLLSFLVYGIVNYAYLQTQISAQIEAAGIFWLLFFSVIVEVLPQPIAPDFAYISALLIGMNVFLVIILTVVGTILGSLLGFELGRIFGTDFTKRLITEKRFYKIKESINNRGKWLIALASITPIPDLALAFGALAMRRRYYIVYGIIPKTLGLIVKIIIVSNLIG